MIELTFEGLIPAKKNNRDLFVRNGKQVNRPNQKYRDWHKYAVIEATSALRGYSLPLEVKPVYIGFIFFMPDYKRRDISNMQQSIEDTLTDVGAITDDAWAFLQCAGAFAVLDPTQVGCKVFIEDEINPIRKVLDEYIGNTLP